MRKTNGQGGITLIALVVTIVVLLILAGITIMYVFGSDGIFATANDAKVESVLGAVRDYVSNAQGQALMESYAPDTAATFDSARAIAVMKANFPSTATINTDADSLTYTDHAYDDGSFTGTFNGVDFTVTFADGVATVTGVVASPDDGT